MPKFKIVIEDSQSAIRQKAFEAPSLDEARHQAEQEDWRHDSWEEIDRNTTCEIRDELCEELNAGDRAPLIDDIWRHVDPSLEGYRDLITACLKRLSAEQLGDIRTSLRGGDDEDDAQEA